MVLRLGKEEDMILSSGSRTNLIHNNAGDYETLNQLGDFLRINLKGEVLRENFRGIDDLDLLDVRGVLWAACGFTIGKTASDEGFQITRVVLSLKKTGSPGDLTLSVRNTSSGVPTGSDLGTTAALTAGSVDTTNFGWYIFSFKNGVILKKTTEYALVLRTATGDASNEIHWGSDHDFFYSGGDASSSTNSGSTWGVEGTDVGMNFEIYGIIDDNPSV